MNKGKIVQVIGPVVDIDGKAVGLNIARADRATSYAIPSNLVQLIASRLLQ